MTINRSELKSNARQSIRGAKPSPVWITLFFFCIVAVLDLLSLRLNGQWDATAQMLDEYLQTGILTLVEAQSASGFGVVISYALDLMSILMSVGYMLFCLRVSRRLKASFGDLFDSFGMFLRALLTYILQNLVISAWAMLYAFPVVYLYMVTADPIWSILCLPLLLPMLAASYNYRLCLYVMMDNPGLGSLRCLGVSRLLMRGHRWQMLKLDLSFAGWFILSLIPFVNLWTTPYYQVTVSGAYNALTADYAAKHQPPPQE